MRQINLKEAETQLAKLIDEVGNDEEIVMMRSDGASLQIVAIALPKPYPKFGTTKGLVLQPPRW